VDLFAGTIAESRLIGTLDIDHGLLPGNSVELAFDSSGLTPELRGALESGLLEAVAVVNAPHADPECNSGNNQMNDFVECP